MRENRKFKNNQLIEKAVPFSSQKKWIQKLSPIWLVLLLIGLFLVAQLIVLPITIPLILFLESTDFLNELEPLIGETLDFTLILIASFIGIHLTMFLWVKFVEKRPFKSIGLWGKKKILKFSTGFMLAVLSMTIAALLVVVFGEGTINEGSTRVVGMTALPYIIIVLLGWFVQASAEEVLFQGWFMPKAAKMYCPVLGIFMSAVMFALFHGLNPGMTLLPFVNLMLYATFAALYAIYEEGIMGIIGFHIAWNWAQGNLFGLEVSGMESISATLVNVTVQSPNIFTGRDFGPEGGLVVTMLLGLSILIVGVLLRKKAYEKTAT
ncbi:type II CAAX endopeptidase family protein [Herbivorax sp. ANBcel31]|uniref:CPBP family intramembrane glutamic endopeptidase n=1 Tax=Herbivorax sp. ANBcel31 TaxID=3069754 RepID=UPI0027B82FFE|nr:type II CAAX endopeptidase family protein [Herbivorax sp. ANBcel31]MDQ2086264.1 type II CAAX endopeptidase family protein [Herbivorax sp. ANBcel31]